MDGDEKAERSEASFIMIYYSTWDVCENTIKSISRGKNLIGYFLVIMLSND